MCHTILDIYIESIFVPFPIFYFHSTLKENLFRRIFLCHNDFVSSLATICCLCGLWGYIFQSLFLTCSTQSDLKLSHQTTYMCEGFYVPSNDRMYIIKTTYCVYFICLYRTTHVSLYIDRSSVFRASS